MMTNKMLPIALLCFLQAWSLPAHSKMIPPCFRRQVALDMVHDAVDDAYDGCTKTMMMQVKNDFLIKEEKDKDFHKAWSKARKCAQKGTPEDKDLTESHLRAICAYTSDDIYKTFNTAVTTGRAAYNTPSFKFHALHFLLVDAIRILKENQKPCVTTYRRTKTDFSAKVGDAVRFGFFASSSLKPDLTRFGKKTCFVITTCLGAHLKTYPKLGNKEEEVLIPPYEMFKVVATPKKLRYDTGLSDCEVLYKLEGAGVHSNLNCKATD